MDGSLRCTRRGVKRTVVTIYPSLPQSSFLGSGEQTLVAQQHSEEFESQDLRFACNTSCTPTIHMSTPTQKTLLDTGASHCLSTLLYTFQAKCGEGKKNSSSSRFRETCPGSRAPRCHLRQQRGSEFAQRRSVAGFSRFAFCMGGHPSCSSIPFFWRSQEVSSVQSFVEHNPPLITFDQMDMLLAALNLAIEDGKRWTRKEWEHYLEIDTLIPYYSFFDSVPSTPSANVFYPAPSSQEKSERSCDRECDCEAQSKGSHVLLPGLCTLEH